MKKLCIKIQLLLLFAMTIIAAQTNIKWEETFDGLELPEGWRVIDADGSGSGLILSQSASTPGGVNILPQAGESFWTSNVQDANLAGVIDEWLISPRISVIYAGDSLYFWAGAIGELFDDSIRVKISTTNNEISSFTNELANFRVEGPAGTWHRYGFDLSAFDSSDIYFAINYYIKDGGPGGQSSDFVWIDHPLITGNPGTINNAPTMVYLQEPKDQSIIDRSSNSVDFKWTASYDSDNEELKYILSIVNVFPQMHFTNLSDTSYSLEWKDLLLENTSYQWIVEVTDGKSTVATLDTFSFKISNPIGISDEPDILPTNPVLYQNYPNPFNPTTTIDYQLTNKSNVNITIYNVRGQEIKTLINKIQTAGKHSINFDATGLASGIYIYMIKTGNFVQTRKMILLH